MPAAEGPASEADAQRLTAAVYANSFRLLQPAVAATGLRGWPSRRDGLRHDGAARVAEEFLVASRLRRRDLDFEMSVGEYFTDNGAALSELVDWVAADPPDSVELPPALPLPLALDRVLARRSTVRAYTGEPVSLAQVATLAYGAAGITHGRPRQPFRATSSAGALYPVELWFAAARVNGLDSGVYAYRPRGHRFEPRGGVEAMDRLAGALAAADAAIMTSQAALVCLLVARPWRSMRKYGPRGMRHVFLEAGTMAGHLNLVCAALGLGCVDCSSVYDDEVHEAFGMDGLYEAVVHAVVIGVAAETR